nr:immunoglobulin heavy chain junction region [Mus musculus]
LCKRGSLCLL